MVVNKVFNVTFWLQLTHSASVARRFLRLCPLRNMVRTTANWETVFASVRNFFTEVDGFECYKFKVGSYNSIVDESYKLPYDENNLAILIINTPTFFETTFKKWLQSQKKPDENFDEFVKRFGSSPIKKFFAEKLGKVGKALLPVESKVIQDCEFTSDGRPKVLMGTCGHVSGAAFFYRPRPEINNNNIIIDGRRSAVAPIRPMGLSLHAKYGGHFAFRAVMIFPKVILPDTFSELKPKMVLDTEEKQCEAIELFNIYWQDGRFRDCGCCGERYSDLQKAFFSVPPEERWKLIEGWFQ